MSTSLCNYILWDNLYLIWLSKQLKVAKSKEPKLFWIALYVTFC